MMARMKVWGGLVTDHKRSASGTHHAQVRTIVAARNQKEAAALVGCTLHEFRGYWSETGNPAEVPVALARPGVVFKASSSMGTDFVPDTPGTGTDTPKSAGGCLTCKHAQWKRTANGRLHPDKSGRCGFVWTPPPVPLAFTFYACAFGKAPTPSGGYIERSPGEHLGCGCYEAAPGAEP